MNAPTLVRPLRLSRPWPSRVVDEIAAGFAALRSAWRRWACRRREARELEAASDLSEATLRDMGAPDWLQAEANARRESRRFGRELLGLERRGADGRWF